MKIDKDLTNTQSSGSVVDDFDQVVEKLRETLQSLEDRVQSRTRELELYADIVENTPIGMYVWQLEDPDDFRSLRMLAANSASAAATGVQPETIIGKRMGESFPGLLNTPIPQIYANVILTGEAVDLGEVEYGDDNVAHSIFAVKAFPLPNNCAGISFENITQRKLQEQEINRRARHLETVAQVSTATSTILDLDELLRTTSTLTRDNFDLYHAHIYLLNDAGDTLVLAAGAGDVGAQMVAEGRSIPLDRPDSIVATAARTRLGHIVNDVRHDSSFLPHPLLPQTQSEMAVPMLVGEELIGVLDVQSDKTDRFSDEDVLVQTTLAAQIAVAVKNARAFGEAERARRQVERIYDTSVDMIGSAGFDGYFKNINSAWAQVLGYTREELLSAPFVSFVHPDDVEATLAEAARIAEEGATTLSFTNRYRAKDGSYHWVSWNSSPDMENELIHFVARDITEQRQQEETREILLNIASRLNAAQTPEAVLDAVADYIVQNGARNAILMYIEDDADGNPEWLINASNWVTSADVPVVPVGTRYYLPEFPFARLWMSSPDKPILIADLQTDDRVDEFTRAVFAQFGIQGSVVMPLRTAKRWVGLVVISWDTATTFDRQDEEIFTALTRQTAHVVDAIRATEAAQQAREEAEILYRVSSAINAAQTEQDLIDALVQHARHPDVTSISMAVFDELDYEQAVTAHVVGEWIGDDTPSMRGVAIPIADFPFVRSIDRHQILWSDDIQQDDRFDLVSRQSMQALQIGSFILAPLTAGERWMGVIGLYCAQPHQHTEREQRIMRNLAQQLSAALAQFDLNRKIERRAAEIETVAQVGAQIATNLNLEDLLWSVANLTRDNFGYYYAHIYMLDEASQTLVLTAGAGDIGRKLVAEGHRIPLDREQSLVARAARTRQAIIVHDVRQEPGFMPNRLLPDTKSELAIPFSLGDQLIGVLDIQDSRVRAFSEAEARAKTILANQIAVAVQNARSFTRTQNALRALESSEARLSQAAGIAKLGHWELDVPTQTFTFSDEFYAIFGTTAEAQGGYQMPVDDYVSRFMYPDDAPLVGEETVKALSATDPAYTSTLEHRVLRADGSVGWILVNIRIEMNEEGQVVRTYGVNQDITARKQQEEEIQRQQVFLRAIIDATPNWIFAKDQNYRYLLVNESYAQAMGSTPEEMIGKDDLDMGFPEELVLGNPEKNIVGFRVDDRQVMDTGQEIHNPYDPAMDKDGNPIIFDTRKIPLFDANNQVYGVLGYAHDITERVRQQEEIARRARELETVAQVSTATTRILDVENLLREVANLTRQSFDLYHAHVYLLDASGENLALAGGAGDAGDAMKVRGHAIPINHERSLVARAARKREGVIVNDITLSPDFLPNPLLPDTRSEMAVPLIVGNRLVGVLDVQSDHPDRFTATDVRVMTTLADQIAVAVENARAYQRQAETAERLREVDRLKSEFLANMSHELRTPLNSIIGYSEVLLDGIDGDLSEDAVEDVKAIHSSGQHLLYIINDILDLAKIEARQMQLDRQEVELAQFAQEVIHAAEILVKNKPVELRLEQAANIPTIYADPVRLRQIIWNILSNAVKFTEQGTVTVQLDMANDEMAAVRVTDTGIGIRNEDLPLVFDQFRQVDGSSTRRAGGTGLGLTITRQLVQLHGGEIHAESSLGTGSTFWFTMPVYSSEKVQG